MPLHVEVRRCPLGEPEREQVTRYEIRPEFDHDADEYESPGDLAQAYIRGATTARTPSVVPVPPSLEADAFLSGTGDDPHTGLVEEIRVLLVGDWSPHTRAAVFDALWRLP
jgi:hypothetical protein